MRTPDFFIVGAPKCGTTALASWLRAHPELFLAPVKEPNYFCFDAPGLRVVDRAETSHLWRRLGLMQVFSPRALAYERIHEYIEGGYSANIVSLRKGAAQVLERRLHPASPAAGVTLAEFSPPRGLIVGAVVRGGKVFVPRGPDRLEAGDLVILFVHAEELATVQLLFPGGDAPA